MKKVLITEKHVLLGQLDDKAGLPLTKSCAAHHALRPFIKEEFSVGSDLAFAFSEEIGTGPRKRYPFTDRLPDLLYQGRWKEALARIERDGPYEIFVEGI